jgi:organic radical activating enzyme
MNETLKVSEVFRSLQGEGPSVGAPCAFLRLAGCNLHCAWCDTKYTWDWSRYDYAAEVSVRTIHDIAAELSGAPRIVITGGEPLIQQRALSPLLALLSAVPVEVETNGTIVPSAALLARVDQWNVSPKLASAGDPAGARIVPEALLALRDSGRAWLKFVTSSPADVDDAAELSHALSWPMDRIMLMPEATTAEELAQRGPLVADAALARGYRYTSRMHVSLWGGRRGT